MTIGKAARAAGVGVETIRFYERKRLIAQPPKPVRGGFRVYPEATVRRIRFIRHAQEAGFSLREAGELLALRADPTTDCAHVRERARATLEEVNRKLERLHRIEAILIELIDTCPGQGTIQECSIITAFEDSTLENVTECRPNTLNSPQSDSLT